MDTAQIYTLVNAAAAQAIGENAIAALDTSTLVSLGNQVFASNDTTEAFLNELVVRIGRTILAERMYENKLGDMVLSDFEYGTVVQKISMHLPDAESDPSYSLTQGQAVEDMGVRKPQIEVKYYFSRTPYMFAITTPLYLYREAFLSESSAGAFISFIFNMVRNAIELSLENLGRLTYANFIAESAGTAREVKLVTLYNATVAAGDAVTAANALGNPNFLKFAVNTVNQYSDYLTDYSLSFNDGSVERFTPKADQRLRVLSEFDRRIKTVVQVDAFNKELVSFENAYKTMNYWQDAQAGSRSKIIVERASDGVSTTVENIMAILYDRDACGVYKHDEYVLTTPVNAAGSYYNTFYHQKQLWFNDLSENFLIFTLN